MSDLPLIDSIDGRRPRVCLSRSVLVSHLTLPHHPPTAIDVADWRRHTEYLGEYARLGERHRVIRWFWDVVEHTLDEGQRAHLLQFTTGGSGVPAQGFKVRIMSHVEDARDETLCNVRLVSCLSPFLPSRPPFLTTTASNRPYKATTASSAASTSRACPAPSSFTRAPIPASTSELSGGL